MKNLKKIITTAFMGLFLFAGAALVYAHECPATFSSGGYTCWYNHGVSPITGKHVCNLNCERNDAPVSEGDV